MIVMPIPHAKLSCAGQRPSNEDEGFSSRRIVAVADGVSTSPDARLAARYAISHAVNHLHSLAKLDSDAIHRLPSTISRALAASAEEIDPAAATCLAVAILNDERTEVWMTAIGDCRISLYHRQPGLDCWAAGPRVGGNRLGSSPCDVLRPGTFSSNRPSEALSVELPETALIIATTDGVHEVLNDEAMLEVVNRISRFGARELVNELVVQALREGSTDNCTAAARFIEGRSTIKRRHRNKNAFPTGIVTTTP